MTGFVLSPAARADLEAIWDYTSERWSPDQAERYILAIGDACESLGSGKRLGQSAEDIRKGYRKLSVGAHVVFYRTDANDLIDIVRILHQRMDLPSRLDE